MDQICKKCGQHVWVPKGKFILYCCSDGTHILEKDEIKCLDVEKCEASFTCPNCPNPGLEPNNE
jgi:hypothetical protein